MSEFLSNLGGLFFGFVLTIAIYSYLWRDNGLYRLAVHILVGVSAAYATVVVVERVLLPRLNQIRQGIEQDPAGNALWLIPVVLALFLWFKLMPRFALFGNGTVAALMGVGAAVALVGAIAGTLIPQVISVRHEAAWISLLAAPMTILALAYFHFTGRQTAEGEVKQHPVQGWLAWAGRIILTITFAALFAGVISTSLALLVDRIEFFKDAISQLLS
jgi:hypothetical protein